VRRSNIGAAVLCERILLSGPLASGDACTVVEAAITPKQIFGNFFRIRDRIGRAMQL
jgi:hypothetical protein